MNVTRWTLCFVRGHSWTKLPYSQHSDTGFFVKCQRCDHEHHGGTSARPTGAGNAPFGS